jgi:hypothetical protein
MNGKKTVTLNIDIWAEWKKPQPITIKVASKDHHHQCITTFKDYVPGGKDVPNRQHKNAFRKLKKVLQENDCWPSD